MIARSNAVRALLLTPHLILAVLSSARCATAESDLPVRPLPDRIVIDAADERAVRALLEKLRTHGETVSYSSRLEPYLDCPAHDELRAHGLHAVPYLLEQVSRLRAVEEYVGAAVIGSAVVPTVEDVAEWNVARHVEAEKSTVGYHVLNILLHELVGGTGGLPAGRAGIVAYRYDSVFRWLDWWRREQNRFVFRTAASPQIRLPTTSLREEPGISVVAHDGLLDVSAVSRSRRAILQQVADAVAERLTIIDDPMMDTIVAIHMNSVTFEESLFLLGRHHNIRGFDVSRRDDGAWVVKRAGA